MAKLTVTDSAGVSSTTTKTVVIVGTVGQTATITAPAGPIRINTPVTFTLDTTGPGVSFWSVLGDSVGFVESNFGTPPPTVTHTFTAPGDYTVTFTADQVESTILVHVVL